MLYERFTKALDGLHAFVRRSLLLVQHHIITLTCYLFAVIAAIEFIKIFRP